MECMRCGNQELAKFAKDKDTWYCRACIGFGRIDVGERPAMKQWTRRRHQTRFVLPYALTSNQQAASKQLCQHVAQQRDTLVFAACGAGKTEIVMELIQESLNQGKKVGFAIPRRQVVLELTQRLQAAFRDLDIVAVCEGHTQRYDADLIVCTMHQLYRYVAAFDVLILDEVDAFPYKGNPLLERIAMQSCKGVVVYLTATPDETMFTKIENKTLALVTLFERPHGHALPIPQWVWLPHGLQWLALLLVLKNHIPFTRPVMVFVPSTHLAQKVARFLSCMSACDYVTSQREDKDHIIGAFQERRLSILVTTTLMERGITVENVQIVIFHAEHAVFDTASIIQICGRVGRKASAPSGEAWLLAKRITPAIRQSIKMLKEMNDQAALPLL